MLLLSGVWGITMKISQLNKIIILAVLLAAFALAATISMTSADLSGGYVPPPSAPPTQMPEGQ